MGRTERNGQAGPLRVAGRYRLVEKLGAGGMSVVWRGYDEVLGRPVAVKVLSPRLAGDQAFRDRLRQEALAAARLAHPHITGIFDFGETPLNGELSVPFVVMELNDGESVAARIGRQGSLDWCEAVTITAEVASALATAHARGLVHRDVTPANVMLTGAGAKVVDFGISAAVGQRDASPDGSLLGTPAYLAPERLGGAQVAAAADVYALGLLLYRSLTGRLPWPAETTAEALRAHLYAAPDPVPDQPGMPSAVGSLCLRCLAKNPADRPRAAEVARSLAALVGLQPVIPSITAHEPSAVPARGAATLNPARRGLGRAALAYLGLPGGTPGPRPRTRTLRLRAGLRIGTALGMGGVRPLGGGVFAGRRPSLPVVSLRHRVQAVIGTVALVVVGGLAWSSSRGTPAVEQAQAAGTAPASVPQGTVCAVRYQLKRDSGSDYEALLTVAATDAVAGHLWRVRFAYPGSQKLTSPEKTVAQKGHKVVVKGRGKLRAFTLRGDYRGVNALPFSFSLNGHRCRAEVLGSMTGPASDDQQGVSEAAGNGSTAGRRVP
ncbi:serine/threonine-protein kinase [Actinoplanes sp. NPDC051411]|uniref:serine/threonine-protein kinase n=1 Tax=Actinoplanes sp. NPDC051411 TaxID=3155522 RepID=UPI0034495EEC